MYINFQQHRVSTSVKTVHTNLFAKVVSCINLQQPIIVLKKHASSYNVDVYQFSAKSG